MKTTSIALAVLSLLVGANAHAFEAIANVVSVTPINETVNQPTQNCWTEYQQTTTQVAPPPQEHSVVGAVIGGVAGGLLGSRFGAGNGRVATAAVGAGVGAIAGDRIGAQSQSSGPSAYTTTTPVQRCQQVDHYDTRTTGYMVVYEYDGQRYSTRLPYNPGSQMRVNVSVTPQ
jgi:uncharacterized protein YcfJ